MRQLGEKWPQDLNFRFFFLGWQGRSKVEEREDLGEGHRGGDEELAEEGDVLVGESVGEEEGKEGGGVGAEEKVELCAEGC